MAIRLLRESSEAPNITNKDDVRMIRYAYGGYNGVIQKYGEQLAGSFDGSTFRIGSGRAVIDGWEIDIDGAGVVLDLSHMSSGVYYYTVYLEVNAELETAEIKYLYDTAQNPTVDPGDDLTEAQSGTARLTLHTFLISYGSISNVINKFVLIPYGKTNHESLSSELSSFKTQTNSNFSTVNSKLSTHSDQIFSMESRLSALGFRQGSCSISASQIYNNSLKRQGKYVLMLVSFYTSTGSFYLYVPSGFRPKTDTEVAVLLGDGTYSTGWIRASDGYLNLSGVGKQASVRILNVGWETADS